ncbi:Y-family DNA polymerase [Facklamia sp. DSM 111018]|uniref:Y-family DNA polymerase n=1 Tax=Facklamia lactis TaxID=2749967 RepID=A0ABS0LMH3_9LACT|nr:Y-family DNA polymerase [Facklamia lactis]MBG9979965.1 Y-family DNA polymerase [Facklamia lactis]MBG9985355.1 Y-family DNA polymerase [Facklamia lactis]
MGKSQLTSRMPEQMFPRRSILCLDCKSFFASVESVERGLHPLRSKLCVVSHTGHHSGVVLAASVQMKMKYEIKTGYRSSDLPVGIDDFLIVPPRMRVYLDINKKINEIFLRYVNLGDWHPYSIDETFLDVTASQRLFGNPYQIAKRIQQEVWNKFGLIMTIGIGDNPLLAKLSLDIEAKEAYPTYITKWAYEDVPFKLWPIKELDEVWGIGRRTAKRLRQMGIMSVYDLAHFDLSILQKEFGAIGTQLYYHAHGIDHSRLSEKFKPRQESFGKSQILKRDYYLQDDIELIIREMTDQVAARLRKRGLKASSVHLSLGFAEGECSERFSHQAKISPSSSSYRIISAMLKLFRTFYRGQVVRRVALSLGNIQGGRDGQMGLLTDLDWEESTNQFEKTIDQIRNYYGYQSLVRASSLQEAGTAIHRSKLLGGHWASGEESSGGKKI